MKKDVTFPNEKRGYLGNDFRIFNLQDTKEMQIESHYHDFNKVVVFISGKVTYCIEGTAYKLQPWDILLINHNTIHKPIIDTASPYKRMVIWIRPSFLQNHTDANCNLMTCFELAHRNNSNLLRITPEMLKIIQAIFCQISDACHNCKFGDKVLLDALFFQLVIYLNRLALDKDYSAVHADIEYDETISNILKYIDNNIADDLSIEKLSSIFFLSKYYLMRKFKHHTGYSIHNYVLQKRLIAANQFIRAGQSFLTACMESGFHDYSNFTRAFKKMYGLSPKKYHELAKYEESNFLPEIR